ncbi:HNH endonuclease [Streptomyces sp. NBC_00268]|uniref:HNH endonuclease n=1 Tax=Streptomyces sp. NBC_00268 TaxID=2975695 RepID=UPI00225A012A|nr:HNH endonuclease [Streptomyces sp. NBC_00268]MCX5184252.1 HNH endonuclease [Streptomyces sp. NBC_00268]
MAMGNGYGAETIFDPGSVQWVLQPRGGRPKRGPQNFEHSVRQGIRLAEYEHVLGEHAELLKGIYPDGVARLWGASPCETPGHVKAVAIRDQKVGDEVLFYALGKFIAKARILGLLRNRELAAAVWGAEEGQKTWEHVMALGDIVEFDVPAAPLLRELVNRDDLRSLTLVSATSRQRHLGLLNNLLGGQELKGRQPSEAKRAASAPPMRRDELLHALGTLDTGISEQEATRDVSLTLLWAIGRLASGQSRLVPRDVCAKEIGPLLLDFGVRDVNVTLEHTLGCLHRTGLWEAEAKDTGGLKREAARLLQKPLTRAEAIGLLCGSYLPDVDQGELLERVGLAGYANASGAPGDETNGRQTGEAAAEGRGRRQVNGSRPDRDPRLAEEVKLLYKHQCQICGERLETRFSHYSEAAHIQGIGRPHEGPDDLSNLLCLCPNHHVQFDKLFLFIDRDWNVRRSRDGKLLRTLIRDPGHNIDDKCVEYHRGLCGRSTYGTNQD